MADNITFHQYNNLHDIEDSWRSLDQQAERLSLGYIHYTYYQTYEWNEFLYHHTLSGLGALTTAMRYDLVRVGGRPFAILPMAVTRSSKKARIPSCRVGGVLNMVCPYPYEGHEEVMEAIAAHLRSSCQGMKDTKRKWAASTNRCAASKPGYRDQVPTPRSSLFLYSIYSRFYLFLRFPLPPLACCGLRSSRTLSAKTKSSWRRSRLACATRMRTGSPSW